MRTRIDHSKCDWVDHVSIVGLAADESDFGHGNEHERLFFNSKYEGRKSLVLSGRPSAAWVREFNQLTQIAPKATYMRKWNSVSLQPNEKRLYFLAENRQLDFLLTDLVNLVKTINTNLSDRDAAHESISVPTESRVSQREKVERFMKDITIVSVV